MSGYLHIRRNSLFVFVSNAVRLATNVLLFVIIARFYGPNEFGQFSVSHLLSTVFLLVADFGFDLLLVASLPRDRTRAIEVTHAFLTTKIALALMATLVMGLTGFFGFSSPETSRLVIIFSFYVLFSSLVNFFFALFRSFEAMNEETKVSLIMNSLLLLVILFLAWHRFDVVVLASAFVASRVVGLALAFWKANAYVPFSTFRFRWVSKGELKDVWIFGLHAIFGSLYFVQDTFLLSAWVGDYAAGVYQAVFKLVFLGLICGDVLIASLLPVLTRLNETDIQKWKQLGCLLHKTLSFVSLPVSLMMIVFPREIIMIVYGESYLADAPVLLQILGIVVFVRYFSDASGSMLTSSNRQFFRLRIVGTAVPLNFLLNLFAIPRYGLTGAAMASLVSALYVAGSYVFFAWQHSGEWFADARTYATAGVSVALGILFHGLGVSFFLAASVCLLVIGTTAYFVGYTRVERAILFSLSADKRKTVGHRPI